MSFSVRQNHSELAIAVWHLTVSLGFGYVPWKFLFQLNYLRDLSYSDLSLSDKNGEFLQIFEIKGLISCVLILEKPVVTVN